MNYQRIFHQMISLPNGEVFVVGGNTTGEKFVDSGSVFQTEIWNPQSGDWRLTASISVPRDYHSTALLMTDGRVIVAGGGYHPSDPNSGGTHQDAQIYSPPYLFSADGQPAARPTIQADFNDIGYGQNFEVSTSGNVSYFSLIKMSSTTHAVNTDARFFKPSFTALGGGRFSLAMHENPNVATPGYWMLFAIDDDGVPSVAEVIKVSHDADDPNNGQPPVVNEIDPSPQIAGQAISYTAVASGFGLNYRWNFGDGTGDSATTPQPGIAHTFAAPGRYIVSVTVTTPEGQEAVETFTQIVHGSLTTGKPVASSGITELPDGSEVWTVNPDNNSVGVIRTSSLSRIAVIPVGQDPRSLAVAPDGRVWVVNKAGATISIINATSKTVEQTVQLDTASRPHGIVFNSHSAYVTLEGTGTLVQLNANTGAERRRVFAGDFPRHLSLRSGGDRLFVNAFITPKVPGEEGASPDVAGQGGEVRIYSTTSNALTLVRTVKLAHINRTPSETEGPGIPNYLGPAIISPDGTNAWIPSKQDNILGGTLRSGTPLAFDQSVRAITSIINLGNETEELASRIDHDNASVASNAAFDPYGLTLFVSLEGNRQISILDAVTRLEIGRFDTGRAPQGVLMSESDNRLYVHNFMDRSVTVYDVSDVVLNGSTDVTLLATIDNSSGEQLSANVLLGKQLFYDARDDRLASLDYMSCASCHNEGGHDGRVWDFTSLGEGVRNTISLRGTGGDAHGLLHWSANFDELQDFEKQIRDFAGGTGLMSDTQFFAGTREEPLGDPKAGISPDLDALAEYMRSLSTPLTSPYRAASGNLTGDANNGRTLFQSKGCAACHSGERFTDSGSSPLLHDIGTLTAASGTRLDGALNGIDTPTLLSAWHTAPYLHDGSANTLADAISAHDGLALTSLELAQLASFVAELSPSDAIEQPGCEAPIYDAATDRALIVWRDCDNIVHVVGAGGNDSASYGGIVTSVEDFTTVTEHSMESSDTLIQSPQNRLAFDISLGGIYIDEFRYQVTDDAASCIAVTDRSAGTVILAGSDRVPVTSPFNPVTFQSCAPPADNGCGSPNVDPLVDSGVYVWKECTTGDWNLMLTGESGGSTVLAGGSISSELGLVSVVPQTLELSDSLVTDDPARAGFDLRTSFPYEDRFSFESQLNDNVCVSLDALSPGYSVFAGPDRTPVSDSFNPETLESCTPPTVQCDPPSYDPGNERALFTWIDCAGDLHLVGTGAAATAQYVGHIYSDTDFTSVQASSFEPSDTLTVVQPNDVFFDMSMGGIWIDEVIVNPTSDAVMCIDINAQSTGTQLFAGADRTPVTSPFNPVTLESCTPPNGQCTVHSVDPAIDEGFYIWRDCSGNWTVTVTGASATGSAANYVGTITASTGFNQVTPLSVEASDSVATTTTQVLEFNLITAFPWEDTFEFSVDEAADLCVTITEMPPTLERFASADRTPVAFSFDPVTLGSCL
ncbi:MAG: DUF1929 domain-containing protein [Gammaproteobacteria bacterium]|nr:DUF1929 domain-containing protein [Gammaproteobacteria bacterium]